MPDHLHGLVEGCSEVADAAKFVTRFRQAGDDALDVISYIIANPVRARICERPDDYPYSGSSRYSVRELAESVQTPRATLA